MLYLCATYKSDKLLNKHHCCIYAALFFVGNSSRPRDDMERLESDGVRKLTLDI